MGFTREEVAMALAVVGPDHGADAERIGARGGVAAASTGSPLACLGRSARTACDHVASCCMSVRSLPFPCPRTLPAPAVDACRKYKSICTMGFRPQHVVGALVTHDGDADLAATTCLEASG